MATETLQVPLRELVLATKDGDWGQDTPQEGHVPYRVIRGADFPAARQGDVSKVPTRFLQARTVDRRTLKPNDILIETAGGSKDRPTGRTLLITERLLDNLDGPATCASFARFLRIDESKADPRFVFWFLQFLYESGDMLQHQVQHTGVARFQFTRFAETQTIVLPPMVEQRAIAAILSCLDDKIEANRQTVDLLWALARSLYKSMTSESELATLGDLLILSYGKGLPATRRTDGPVPVIGSGGVTGWHDQALVDGPGVVVGRKGTIGTVYWVDSDFFPIDTTFYAVPNDGVPMIVAYLTIDAVDFSDMNSDSAVPGLNRNAALAKVVPILNAPDMERLAASAEPLAELAHSVERESKALRGLRDSLLRALLDGSMRVGNLATSSGEAI